MRTGLMDQSYPVFAATEYPRNRATGRRTSACRDRLSATPEEPADTPAIRAVVAAGVRHRRRTRRPPEVGLVDDAARQPDAWLPELSMVGRVRRGGRRLRAAHPGDGASRAGSPALALGPVAVRPADQSTRVRHGGRPGRPGRRHRAGRAARRGARRAGLLPAVRLRAGGPTGSTSAVVGLASPGRRWCCRRHEAAAGLPRRRCSIPTPWSSLTGP